MAWGGEIGQGVGAVSAVSGGFGQSQCLDPGALRGAVVAGVVGGERDHSGQFGGNLKQFAADGIGVGAAQKRCDVANEESG
ncbi:hypothetical protein [Actinomadura sp. 3N407]|uniref:hypothetical protein n=1 Tax=Actinomadura sp. 3N407 TaxID=3457423 RepID=UPI003FCDEDDB